MFIDTATDFLLPLLSGTTAGGCVTTGGATLSGRGGDGAEDCDGGNGGDGAEACAGGEGGEACAGGKGGLGVAEKPDCRGGNGSGGGGTGAAVDVVRCGGAGTG